MYKDYFGFLEQPFSIVPNARYLFLSTRHREAMRHLQAGLGEGGGFAMLTGEVGTGKTTVSKAMMSSLDENIEAGLILNPTFSESDLLEAICDEFKLDYPQGASLKVLNRVISDYLHQNDANGKQTLLLIDEAQHLGAPVLEQLRLLTNLETDSHKLLKVLLVGQPELQIKLQTSELRQLAQRITGRYHLLPLTEEEISQYIEFRVKTAGVERKLFQKKAIKVIARETGGIPRLINLVCDKALQYAFYNGEKEIHAGLASKACEDVMSFQAPSLIQVKPKKKPLNLLPLYSVLVSTALLASTYRFSSDIQDITKQQLGPVPIVETIPSTPVTTVEQDIALFLQESEDQSDAMQTLYRLWGVEVSAWHTRCDKEYTRPYICDETRAQSFGDIKALNRPVVMLLQVDGKSHYTVLYAVYGDTAELLSSSLRVQVPLNWLLDSWSGRYITLWENQIGETLRVGNRGEKVILLDNLLSQALEVAPIGSAQFDEEMQERVIVFQAWQGLDADGIAGAQTLKYLDRVANTKAPSLKLSQDATKGEVL